MTLEPKTFRDALAAVIRIEMADRRVNAADLSRWTQLPPQTIRRTIIAERDPTLYDLLLIANALDMPYQDLVDGAAAKFNASVRERVVLKQSSNREI